MRKHTSKITLRKLWVAYFKLTFTQKINRLPRSYFWLFQIFLIIEGYIVGGCYVAGTNLMKSSNQSLAVLIFAFGFAVLCLLVISNLAIHIARLHDSDHSAWNLLWAGLPYIGGIILWIIMGFYGSTQGDNKYGMPFDYDKLETLPSEDETGKDAFEFEQYDINKSKKPVEKTTSSHAHAQLGNNKVVLHSLEETSFDSEEYWGLISFAYSKIKQTGIFKLWRKEQFDCQFGKCAICNKPMEFRFAQVDHIKPRYKKGTNYSNNLALVHKKCNELKGAKSGYERPNWIRSNKYSEKLDEKVYEITEEIRVDYPTKFPDELFTKPTSKA